MKKYAVIFSFIPWFLFSFIIEQLPHQINIAAMIAVILTIIIDYKHLKKMFFFPLFTCLYFFFVILNTQINIVNWFNNYQIAVSNCIMAIIIWVSIIINKPFTIQYAKEQTNSKYWSSPLFKKSNLYISLLWAIMLSIIAIPSIFISQDLYVKSFFWNYIFSTLFILVGIYFNHKIPDMVIGNNFWQTVKKLPLVDSLYLKNGFAPIHNEIIKENLSIIGDLPVEIDGRYLRNGPNPYFIPYTYTYPIDGDGMIHELKIEKGVVSYKNKFVKTQGLLDELKANKALFGGNSLPIPPDPKYTKEKIKNTASIGVLAFNDKIVALFESEDGYLLDNQLNTLGIWQPNNQKITVNAHYRIDANTKQTYMCSYNNLDGSFLTIHEFNANNELVNTNTIYKKRLTMIHDFVITQNYIIIFDTPAIFNLNPDFSNKNEVFFSYNKDEDVKVLLISRKDYNVKTIENIPSFFVYHFINAYELNEQIIIDFVLHESLVLDYKKPNSEGPKLYRAFIDSKTFTYSHQCLITNLVVEFPIYNTQYTAINYNFAYIPAKNESYKGVFNQIIKYNFTDNTYSFINFGDNVEVGEPVFIPKSKAYNEDDGYIGCYIYDIILQSSQFVILDAKNINCEICRINMPQRVPHGLHGVWQPNLIIG